MVIYRQKSNESSAAVMAVDNWQLWTDGEIDAHILQKSFGCVVCSLFCRRCQVSNERPVIVCLCGSTRFMSVFHEIAARETLANKIVVGPACVTTQSGQEIDLEIKRRLDELHKRKIELADEVFIVNVGGYIGSSTRGEIAYAR